jgi:hypothetical protein
MSLLEHRLRKALESEWRYHEYEMGNCKAAITRLTNEISEHEIRMNELLRLRDIIANYAEGKLLSKVKEAWTPDTRSFEEAEKWEKLREEFMNCFEVEMANKHLTCKPMFDWFMNKLK